VWLRRRLARGGLTSTVIAAFSGSLFVFTAAQLVIGVALAPRYSEPMPRSPDAIYGNDLAQQITSTFDVVICALSLAILVAVLVTGPLSGWLVRRRATPAAAPTAAAPAVVPRPPNTAVPKIVRLKEDSTQLMAPATTAVATTEVPVATTALRIQRRPSPQAATDATEHIPAPSDPDPDEGRGQ
jgi:hypothetical protein